MKIVLNTGIDAEADKNQIADVQRDLGLIAGQKPVLAKAKKAISNFKLKQGQIVGCHVTLRGNAMWEFLYRLIAVALPTIRDFRGVSPKLDGQGNYNLGITDFTIFPEITVEHVKKSIGPRHHDRHLGRDRRRGPRAAAPPRHALPPHRTRRPETAPPPDRTMPKTSAIERNKKRIRLVAKYAKKRAELKAILANPATTDERVLRRAEEAPEAPEERPRRCASATAAP